MNSPRIYLASRSPRRRELLKQIGVQFELLLYREARDRGPDVDETPLPGERPDDYVRRICTLKAAVAWQRVGDRRLRPMPVLAADTVVCLGDRILGKPADAAEAAAMLRELAGREHRVLSAVGLRFGDRFEMRVSESFVVMRELTDDEIRRYVATGEPMDKAGAYAIQGRAAVFIRELRGSYSGVVGLPLYETAELLALDLRTGPASFAAA